MARGWLFAVLFVCCMAVTGVATPMAASELIGTWGNVDTLAAGLAEVKIVLDDGALSIFGYGVCDPSFCEWGSTPSRSLACGRSMIRNGPPRSGSSRRR
jgi:hypothetical protein